MNAYCKLPFGKLNHQNQLIIEVAEKMNRTPSSVSMKLCNLASFDPALQARGVKGLTGASRADRRMWDAFTVDWNGMSEKSEAAFDVLMGVNEAPSASEQNLVPPTGPSEATATVKTRRHQAFFRSAVLSSYEYQCALSRVKIPALLNASHIVAWSEDEGRRADPTNGICLNVLYDRAFDRHLITFDEDYRLIVSDSLRTRITGDYLRAQFLDREGQRMELPHRFLPDVQALALHREKALAQ